MDSEAAIAVLTAMITPAVLISACGSMILSTSTRLGRVVDRVGVLSDQIENMPDGNEKGATIAAIVEQHKPHFVHFRRHE